MDPRFLQYYNRELQHVREMGVEFAKEFPKIAGRLGIDSLEVSDPYVERLLEGFAFMAARVQLKLDAEYPHFTQHLIEMVYPHYLAPVPSMMVAQINPELANPGLIDGYKLPRHTALRGIETQNRSTPCEYRTAHDLTLWPIELEEARYFSTAGALANLNIESLNGASAGLRFQFRCKVAFNETSLESLPIFLSGPGDLPKELYQQLLGNCCGVIVRPKGGVSSWQERLSASSIKRHGFEARQALLPYTHRSFDGYRLLQEYFAFPSRFLFVELADLEDAVKRCGSTELEVVVLFNRSVSWMEGSVDKSNFSLFCTPAVNLFEKRAGRINVDRGKSEFHVIPDRTKPMDLEVHSVLSVKGFSGGAETVREFKPFYTARDPARDQDLLAYYTLNREPRKVPSSGRRESRNSSYIGNEVFLSIVDGKEAPFAPDLKQLEILTLCTNRDLPLHMTLGKGVTDFSLEIGAPVDSVRCISGPTAPKPSPVRRENAWRLLNHLSLNYLSIIQEDGEEGAGMMQQLLSLYADTNEASAKKQIEGLRSISAKPVVRRLPVDGMISFGRGLEVSLTCEETFFEGTGAFTFGCVMEEFLSKYVALNSFTETVLKTTERGEVMRWPARVGRRDNL